MLTLPPLLAVLALAAFADAGESPPLTGTVVDSQGQPLRDVAIYLSCGRAIDGSVPALGRARTDEQGRFRLEVPSLEQLDRLRAPWDTQGALWAYQPGKALTGVTWSRWNLQAEPFQLVLHEPGRRSITLRGPDGAPVVGARLAPYLLYQPRLFFGILPPDELVERLETRTGPDGRADLPITPETELLAVRIGLDAASHLLVLDREKESKAQSLTVTLKPTGRLVGRVTAEGGKAPGEDVSLEVWSLPGNLFGFETVVPVAFQGGPVRIAADGSF
ncbi:MAG: hypothetical protein IRY99_03140 [Isosphaeraceae bacterium]|nr:hypothetical protein [Isosphaeraceae bacterium]